MLYSKNKWIEWHIIWLWINHSEGTMNSKQCRPSNSGANLCLDGAGICFVDVFGSLASLLEGFEFPTFAGLKPKEKLHFWAWEISKWLNIDINMFVKLCCVWKIKLMKDLLVLFVALNRSCGCVVLCWICRNDEIIYSIVN